MSENKRDCEHGQLARVCYICELEAENARLKKENTALEEAVQMPPSDIEKLVMDCGELVEKVQAENARLKGELADALTECTRLRKGWADCHKQLVEMCHAIEQVSIPTELLTKVYKQARKILKELEG